MEKKGIYKNGIKNLKKKTLRSCNWHPQTPLYSNCSSSHLVFSGRVCKSTATSMKMEVTVKWSGGDICRFNSKKLFKLHLFINLFIYFYLLFLRFPFCEGAKYQIVLSSVNKNQLQTRTNKVSMIVYVSMNASLSLSLPHSLSLSLLTQSAVEYPNSTSAGELHFHLSNEFPG